MKITKPPDLSKRSFIHKESQCTIISDDVEAVDAAISSILTNRSELEKFISENQEFLHSLQPIKICGGPRVVRLMAEAAERSGVGPMASVAGVLADLAVEDMINCGAETAVVENGGEISLQSRKPVDVALQAGDYPLSRRMGFRLKKFPKGIATSSGIYSHAFSFGESEATTVFAENAGLADAAATAVCNAVRGENYREAIQRGINIALAIRGVEGVFITYREQVGFGGEIPQIIGVST